MVNIITSDSKIWNKEEVITDIIKESIISQNIINIDLNMEGPSCKNTQIDEILNNISKKFNIPSKRFVINTANQIPSSQYTEIRYVNDILSGAKKKAISYIPTYSTLDKIFGIFIGRSNWQRLGLASYLWNNYKNNSIVTFHYDNNIEYHKSNLGLDEFCHKFPNDMDNIFIFLKELPLVYDEVSYPILWSDNAYDLDELYKNIFCEIVCETYFSGKTFFISEKTYRCILNKRPFIIQGPTWFLKNLKKLGFKTFDKWWDEGYDEDPSDARYETLKRNINWIGSQGEQTINGWYEEMQPILTHNYNVLCNLTNETILNTEFYYE